MEQKKEYRATHDEKNGVLKELNKLETEWKEQSDREIQRRLEVAKERVRTDPRLTGMLAKYIKAKAKLEAIERAVNEIGACVVNSYSHGPYLELNNRGNMEMDIRNEVNQQLMDRLRRLSEIRSRINLANLRSEVARLDKAARSL